MAEIANLILPDRNPTNRTFEPTSKDGLIVTWRYFVGSTPALYPTLTLSARPYKAGVNRKVTVKLTVPEEVTIDGEAVIKSPFMAVDFVVPEECTTAATQDLLAYAAYLFTQTIFTDAVVLGKQPY